MIKNALKARMPSHGFRQLAKFVEPHAFRRLLLAAQGVLARLALALGRLV